MSLRSFTLLPSFSAILRHFYHRILAEVTAATPVVLVLMGVVGSLIVTATLVLLFLRVWKRDKKKKEAKGNHSSSFLSCYVTLILAFSSSDIILLEYHLLFWCISSYFHLFLFLKAMRETITIITFCFLLVFPHSLLPAESVSLDLSSMCFSLYILFSFQLFSSDRSRERSPVGTSSLFNSYQSPKNAIHSSSRNYKNEEYSLQTTLDKPNIKLCMYGNSCEWADI